MKNARAIITIIIANTISGAAQGISMLAIPWYFARTGDMGTFGIIYLLTNMVSMIWVPYAGVLVDKYSRKHVFLAITAICGIALAIVSMYGFVHEQLPVYLIAAVFMVNFFNYNIHFPNLYAFMQEVTEPENYGRITSILEVQGQLTTMAAGAGAAILLEGTQNGMLNVFGFLIRMPWEIEPWPLHRIFALDGLSYLLGFIVILAIRYTPLVERKPEMGRVFDRLRVGLDYLLKNKHIFIFGVASYCVFVVIMVMGFYLDPMYVKNHLNESGAVFAASEMYYALGAVLAGALVLRAFRNWSIPTGVIILTFLGAVTFSSLGFFHSVIIFYVIVLISGITNAGTRILRVNYLFKNVPNQVYGRTNSIFTVTNIIGRIAFIGLFSLPFFTTENHVIYAFIIVGVFLVGAAWVLIRHYRSFVPSD